MSSSTPPSANPPCQQYWRCPPQHLPQRIRPVNSIGDVPLNTSLSESVLSTVLEMSPSVNPPCQQYWRCPPQHLPQRIRPLNSLGENQPCQQSWRCPPSTPPSAKSALSTHSLTGQACRERSEPFVCPAFVSCRWPVCRLMEWHAHCAKPAWLKQREGGIIPCSQPSGLLHLLSVAGGGGLGGGGGPVVQW